MLGERRQRCQEAGVGELATAGKFAALVGWVTEGVIDFEIG